MTNRMILSALHNLLWGAALVAVSPFLVTAPTTSAPEATPPVINADHLIQKHDCWTGEAPADMRGKVPGHVIISEAGTPRRGGAKAVDQALGQIFEGEDHGLEVYAFCR